MPAVEEIVYEAGRAALSDQERIVSGVRQRTGTLLAAHALVASFLGATVVKMRGLQGFWVWGSLVLLVAGLVLAAGLLINWRLEFALDARKLYGEVYGQADAEVDSGTLGWLISVANLYQDLREGNSRKVVWMSRLLTVLAVVVVAQTLFWLIALR